MQQLPVLIEINNVLENTAKGGDTKDAGTRDFNWKCSNNLHGHANRHNNYPEY